MLALYTSLFKWRETSLLVFVALVSALIAGWGSIPGSTLVVLAAVGMLSCAGSACLNNYLDRDIDAIALRTRKRPLPEGRISPKRVWWLGVMLIASGVLLAIRINRVVSFFVLMGALVYVMAYTLLLKRKSPLNIEVGGLAGSCAALAGWFSVFPTPSYTPLLLALLLFLWTPPHFWSFAIAKRNDYAATRIPVLPVLVGNKKTADRILVYASFLLIASVSLYLVAPFNQLYLAGAILSGGFLLRSCIGLSRQPTPGRAWNTYKLSGVYLLSVFLAMVIDTMVGS